MLSQVTGLGEATERVRAGFPVELELPPAFAEMLAAAIALDEGLPRAQQLRRHYLELMPRQRAEQLASPSLLHEPLDWARLPRLSGAIDRLHGLLSEAGASPKTALGFDTSDEFRQASPSLAAIYRRSYYGGFMPLLYGYPADLAHAARQLERDDAATVIDRCLTAPLLHELTHLDRRRHALLPLYLDECVAAWLGVRVLPEFAYPAPGELGGLGGLGGEDALYAAPWFAQVGQALARVVGAQPLLRAHAGIVPWRDVLPAGFLDAALRRGWQEYLDKRAPHFLSDNFRPEPWLELIFRHAPPAAETPEDADILADALRAMCLRNHQVGGSFRVSLRLPTPVEIDLAACRVTSPPGDTGFGFDPVPLAYLFPPATAARLQQAGIKGFSLMIDDVGAIPDLVRVIMRGEPWPASSSSIRLHPSR